MRETTTSLRVYFFVVGGYLGATSAVALLGQPSGLRFAAAILAAAFAVAFLYCGVRLERLLVDSPEQVFFVVVARAIPSGLALVIAVMDWDLANILGNSLELLIVWYLCVNVRRLSSDAAGEPLQGQ